MTAWQVKDEGIANDHSDAGYDGEVLQRLAAFQERAVSLLRRIGSLAPRLEWYGARLSRAAQRIAAGDVAYIAKVVIDSYHTVWFELHEELLTLAERKRAVND
jgi:pyruvate, orthophosphate dikinase